MHDLGEHALKDISARVHLYELVVEGLPSDFPPIRTLDAHPSNMPPSPTALVGREQEVTRLVTALQSQGTRLITLRGPGGTGKTGSPWGSHNGQSGAKQALETELRKYSYLF
ncbi:MAG: hypothetical protein ACR2MC_00875 [Actinomycetota bacterium]